MNRTIRRFLLWVPPIALSLGLSIAPANAQGDEPEPARPRLVGEFTGLVPGQTNTIALTFDLDDGWHTYWPGQNDTGLPVAFELTLPEGFEAGKPMWPAPHRHESKGGILDHIYEKTGATVLIPVQVPSGLAPGQSARIMAEVDWLACREACIPGWGTVELTIPVLETGERPSPSPDAGRIAEARRRVPVPLPKNAKDLALRWIDGVLEIRAKRRVKRITFAPHEDGRAIESLRRDGASDKGVLRLTPEPGDKPVAGVVELVLETGERPRLYSIETSPPNK